MYVCSCQAVNDHTVETAITAGARSVDDLARLCGAGASCGGCWPVLQEMLDGCSAQDAHAVAVASSAA